VRHFFLGVLALAFGRAAPIAKAADISAATYVRAGKLLNEGGCRVQRLRQVSFPIVSGPWVPHISLVFREMWDTTDLNRSTSKD
jgi:hypothetical protein